ncbi:hypothetical protein WOLCODRAFT_67182 [Wolfiporia cocos MD-104 SS10]|uniref:C2H2-type domain-containing protein n=1 Tax=Wolfiporia cocos (strain MD-104) TaxID=742152 RepID=A0A2H3JDL9_WOLCO|nr:hypothetical protein WOLCODRAFT_67182 [Wolfiporia cocos MD-104 SS10]
MDHLAYFAPSCASRSSPLNPAIVCQWGTSCGISLPHCSFSTIKRHIREYHFGGDAHGWHDQLRGHCMWSVGGNVCGKEVMYGHFGKHIATVHTRSVYRRCSRCHQEFSRGDSLQRHQKHYCPAGRP